MKTSVVQTIPTTDRKWWLFNANDAILGNLAVEVANRLRGRHKEFFSNSGDIGDYVVVTNASKVRVTGNKEDTKMYRKHSGYRGLKEFTFLEVRERDPSRIIFDAVRGMLPKNKLSRNLISRLRVFPEGDHEHESQQPEEVVLK